MVYTQEIFVQKIDASEKVVRQLIDDLRTRLTNLEKKLEDDAYLSCNGVVQDLGHRLDTELVRLETLKNARLG